MIDWLRSPATAEYCRPTARAGPVPAPIAASAEAPALAGIDGNSDFAAPSA
ncbi:MAG: hypothetical protein E7J78_06935 [Pantoea sp.]|nr:hypothetical protein [Pantoea sp.]